MLATAVVGALALSSCSGGTPGQSASGAPAEKATVSFASWHWLEKGRSDRLWALMEKFMAQHENITIEKREIARKDYERTLSTEFGAQGGPDVFLVPDTYYAELAESGVLAPLDDVVSQIAGRLPAQAEQFRSDGTTLALPYELSPYGFFWNKALLEEANVQPPTTPQELLDAAVAIKEKTGKTGFAVRHQMNEEAVWWLDYANWPFGFGGGWSDGTDLTIDQAANVEALTWYKKIYDSGAFAVGDDASTFRSKFAEGQVGMMIDCLTCMRTITGSGGSVTSQDVGGGLLPFPQESFSVVALGLGANGNSANLEATKTFLAWLYSSEAQDEMLDINFPSTAGLAIDPPQSMVDAYPWSVQTFTNIDKGQSPVIPGFELKTPQIRTIVLTQIEQVLTKNLDPAEALQAAQSQADALR
ncbi:MAG: sugar ABC transporter substrate-binding protein [Propionibacteriaceae bacterium]|nr:sugar ABC transporter substrate-binding protein [Propionibacteriaceae bacterium]